MPLAKEIRTFQLQSPKVLIFSLRVRSISAAILGTVLFSWFLAVLRALIIATLLLRIILIIAILILII